MQENEYQAMFEHEDRYWWFVARRRLAIRLLRRALGVLAGRRLIDLGCGTGAALTELQRETTCAGLDFSALALDFCRSRGLNNLVLADGSQMPLRSDSFQGMIALDTFEHIPDVDSALRESCRVLAPGGVLVLSVPAYRWLWGPHDVSLMHQRRYTLAGMRRDLVAAGFTVEHISYSVFFLFPIVVGFRVVDKFRRGPAKVRLPGVSGPLNRMLIRLMDFESGLIERMRLPFGSSVVAVARKPGKPGVEQS